MELEGVRQPFRQTKSSLLDSNDQYTFLCMMLNDTLNTHDKHWTKMNLAKFTLWMCPLSKGKFRFVLKIKKNKTWFVKKLDMFL